MSEFFISGLREFSKIILTDNEHRTFKVNKAHEETKHNK